MMRKPRLAALWMPVAVAAFLAAGTPAIAQQDPSLHQVYEAVQAGRLDEAQSMMSQVLRDHPNSGKAHYVEAEVLAKQHRYTEAEAELNLAERHAPGLPFAKPESVRELRAAILQAASSGPARVAGASAPYVASSGVASSGFPWGAFLLIGAIVAAIAVFVRARRAAQAQVVYGPQGSMPYGGYGGYGGAGPAAGGGYPVPPAPMAPMGGGLGGGILGGLATGAAVGAGMVAGEALAHDLIDGHGRRADAPRLADAPAPYVDPNADAGGSDFGVSDGGSWDDGGGLGGGGGSDDWN